MSSTQENAESAFARKVGQALNETVTQLPQTVLDRLAVSRRLALAHKKSIATAPRACGPTLVAVGKNSLPPIAAPLHRCFRPLSRLGLMLPVIAIAAILFAVASWEDRQHIAEIADIDAAMLIDTLPLSAYLDHGFHAYLSHTS